MSYPLRKDQFIKALSEAADGIEIRYNAPVYLVGSYLEKGNEALDVDVVIVFSDKQLKQVFGPDYFENNFSEKNFRFRLKQKEWLEQHEPISMWDIDFKEQSIKMFKYYAKQKLCFLKRLGSYAKTCYLKEAENEMNSEDNND